MVGNVSGVYGFYRSINGGASWTRINDDAHQFGAINALAADPNIYGRIYLGTAGRGIIYGDNLSTLPVSLVSFNAKLKETNLATMGTLNWQTTSEKDFSHFIVERSTNGSNWLAIGKVNGAGATSLTNYAYEDDISLVYGDIFYRLKMEDKDGKAAFSNIARIKNNTMKNQQFITITPNPVVYNTCQVTFFVREQKAVNIRIISGEGITVYENERVSVAAGNNSIMLTNLDKIKAGIYFVEIADRQSKIASAIMARQ